MNEGFVLPIGDHPDNYEDSDVIHERDTVSRMLPDRHPIIVRNLSKTYGRLEAVKNLNFHVDMTDCFGLLGVNGEIIIDFQMFEKDRILFLQVPERHQRSRC